MTYQKLSKDLSSPLKSIVTYTSICYIKRNKQDRKSTRLNSSHQIISYAVFCLKKKKKNLSTIMTRATITGRALIAVIDIITILATITTGSVLLLDASVARLACSCSTALSSQHR